MPLPYWVENGRRVLFVSYKGDCRVVRLEGKETLVQTHTLADVFSCVRPGDILQLLPGMYWPPILYNEDTPTPPVCKPIKLVDTCGKPDVPITIRGMGAATILNGGLGGVPHDSMLPEMKHFAFFKLAGCSWIEFENLTVHSCWPTFLYIEDSSYITLRGVRATDSRYLLYARGQATHHVLVEDCHWRQDPTSSMWRDLLWLDSKLKRYFYYNGGIFGSLGISGSVVIRRNVMCDTFNGLRLKTDKGKHDVQNFNLEVYENEFVRTRDNPVEPERGAVNWWIHHNRIKNAHAWFSLDEVAGGFWYYFANVGYITDKPGNCLDPNRGGKVYKYDEGGAMPEYPVFAFNNSYWLCASLIKSGTTTYLTHRDNAVLFANGTQYPGETEEERPCPMPLANEKGEPYECSGDDRFSGTFKPAKGWDGNVTFDYDLCNLPLPPELKAGGQEASGYFGSKAQFRDPKQGDLRLKGTVPKGGAVTLKAGKDWAGDTDWTSGPDTPVGAYLPNAESKDKSLVDGPAFAFLSPKDYKRKDGKKPSEPNENYVEMPRLVRLAVADGTLILIFSTPLELTPPVRIRVKYRGGKDWFEASVAGRELLAVLPKGVNVKRLIRKVWIPDTLKGANGQYATLWSSVFAGLKLYATGKDSRVKPPVPVCFCDCGEEL